MVRRIARLHGDSYAALGLIGEGYLYAERNSAQSSRRAVIVEKGLKYRWCDL